MKGKEKNLREFVLCGVGARVLVDLSRVYAVRDQLNDTCTIVMDEGVTYSVNERFENVKEMLQGDAEEPGVRSSARMLFLVQMFLEEWAECYPLRGATPALLVAVRDLKAELAEELERKSGE